MAGQSEKSQGAHKAETRLNGQLMVCTFHSRAEEFAVNALCPFLNLNHPRRTEDLMKSQTAPKQRSNPLKTCGCGSKRGIMLNTLLMTWDFQSEGTRN